MFVFRFNSKFYRGILIVNFFNREIDRDILIVNYFIHVRK